MPRLPIFVVFALLLPSCTAAQGRAIEAAAAHVACELIEVLSGDTHAGAVCAGISGVVQGALDAAGPTAASGDDAAYSALACRRKARRIVRLVDVVPTRDPRDGETIGEEHAAVVRAALSR